MRQVYAHQATLVPGGDPGPPGAAVITALGGDAVLLPGDPLRILFAAEPHRVAGLRDLIDATLAAGEWQLISSGCARVGRADRPHARRLLESLRSGRPGS